MLSANPNSKRRQNFAAWAPDWLSGKSKYDDQMKRKSAMTANPDRGDNSQNKRRKTNSGAYARNAIVPLNNAIVVSRNRVPRLTTRGDGVVVQNTEYLSDVNLQPLGAFNAFNLAMIPTLTGWIGQMADLFSKYRWRKLRLIYIPSCPTTTSGVVGMAWTYDRQDGLPTTVIQLSQTNRSIVFPPYAGFGGTAVMNSGGMHPEAVVLELDTSRVEKTWYNIIGTTPFVALPTNVQTMYCPATVQVLSEGGPAALTRAGTLYMQYEIEFIEPISPVMNA